MRPRRIIAQLVLGASEQKRFTQDKVLHAVSLATRVAGLDSLLFWPSGKKEIDAPVLAHVRSLGVKPFLWLPVLADAGSDPGPEDWFVGAGGQAGHGLRGRWDGIGKGDETFLFACPRSPHQINAALDRCRNELPDYDGVFVDRIRCPSPANGFETLFGCFCPRCLEHDPRAIIWKNQAAEVLSSLGSAGDADLDRWGTWNGFIEEAGLSELMASREETIVEAAGRVCSAASGMGREVGLDLFTPALSGLVGQDYRRLGGLADWIKPMSYCHAKGPAGLPLELCCLARGLMAVGRLLTERAVMEFVGRSFSIAGISDSTSGLERDGLDELYAGAEYHRASQLTPVRLYPGFECVLHPDFDLNMTEDGVKRYMEALSEAPGVALAWNILYTPDRFLEIVAEG